MNIEGRALLARFGFTPPSRNAVLRYADISQLDLVTLYQGNRCGASIEVAPTAMKLSHGPNWFPKLSGAHNVPQSLFFEAFDHVIAQAEHKGIHASDLTFAFCQSIPHEVTFSGMCARVEEAGIGYLACDVLGRVRSGDFIPDYSLAMNVVGGRAMGHTTKITSRNASLPSWAIHRVHKIVQHVNKMGEGIFGVEFVLDTQFQNVIFHDMYWALKPYEDLAQKFKLR